MQRALVTGNSSLSVDFFKQIAPQVHVALGDMDDEPFPEELVVEVGEFKIGLVHGHQVVPWGDKDALCVVARRLGVDILVSGHTHASQMVEHDGVWLINPGSATGYFSPTCDSPRPTFICMSIMGSAITNYLYELDPATGEVQVHKTRLVKASADAPASAAVSPRPAAQAVAPEPGQPAPQPRAEAADPPPAVTEAADQEPEALEEVPMDDEPAEHSETPQQQPADESRPADGQEDDGAV
jgi:vacuolar protein sorting-associated protein 29